MTKAQRHYTKAILFIREQVEGHGKPWRDAVAAAMHQQGFSIGLNDWAKLEREAQRKYEGTKQ